MNKKGITLKSSQKTFTCPYCGHRRPVGKAILAYAPYHAEKGFPAESYNVGTRRMVIACMTKNGRCDR